MKIKQLLAAFVATLIVTMTIMIPAASAASIDDISVERSGPNTYGIVSCYPHEFKKMTIKVDGYWFYETVTTTPTQLADGSHAWDWPTDNKKWKAKVTCALNGKATTINVPQNGWITQNGRVDLKCLQSSSIIGHACYVNGKVL